MEPGQFRLEVVVIPVSDVDRAKQFYKALGWRLDANAAPDDPFRVVQLTPPGSPASIIFGTNVTDQAPGTAQGLHLIVSDIEAARTELQQQGADVSEVFHDAGGVFHHGGTDARVPGPAPARASYGSFLSFSDIPTATGGCCRRSPRGCPGASTRSRRPSPRPTTWPPRCGARRRRTGNTRPASARRTRTGRLVRADYMVREQAGIELPS